MHAVKVEGAFTAGTMWYMSTPHGPTPLSIGRRIRGRREELGLDQEQVADLAKLSRPYISRLERGIVPNPKLMDLSQVAEALGLTLCALLGTPIPNEPDADIATALVTRFGPQFGTALVRIDRVLAQMEHGDTAALAVLVGRMADSYEPRLNA